MGFSKLVNELVWSHSRARLFDDCLRAYWFTYYGSWEGWDANAPSEARSLYVQKKLTRRPMWVGTVVHGIAEEGLKRARAGRHWSADEAAAAAVRQARGDIEGSRTGTWLQRPAKRTGFAEHYYGEAVGDADWDASIAEIERQVRGLHENRIYRRLVAVADRIRDVEELHRFRVGDADVYVALDALVADGKGGVVIIDWKTGEAHDDATIAAQLGVYGLYVTQELGVPPDQVTAMHVNLRHATETTHRVGPPEIAAAQAEIAETVTRMRARLDNVAKNTASKDGYPLLEEGAGRCNRCNFRRTCGREAAATSLNT